MDLDWEQKLEAIKALLPGGAHSVCLRMREPGNWYVETSRVHVVREGIQASASGSGATPEAAVDTAWGRMTDLPKGANLIVEPLTGPALVAKWNGFMWVTSPVEKPQV